MKKFRFSLRSVQTVRSIVELRAREAFSASLLAHNAAAAQLAEARTRIRELDQLLLDSRNELFRPSEQVAYLHEQVSLRQAENVASQALVNARRHMEECREAWIRTRRDVRVIENLEVKARERHRLECDHEEQAAMDDRVNAMVGRAPLILS